ncbi:MAG: asparagine synthase-related protein [Patulibacter sp.]
MSFSGGRDSSAVLAAAVAVARRDGLPLPVPVTLRQSGSEGADETAWQELVVQQLGLDDWVRIEVADRLDLVGDIAQGVYRQVGLRLPFNLHFHQPILEVARGGSLLTGIGGDELTSPRGQRAVLARLRYHRRVPRRRQVRALVKDLAPRPVRARWNHNPDDLRRQLTWLTPEGFERFARRYFPPRVKASLSWETNVRRWWTGRDREGTEVSFRLLGAAYECHVAHPFEAEPFVHAACARYGGFGPPTRADVVRELFGDVLPTALIERQSKAWFDSMFFTERSRRAAEAWDGTGIDHELVDAERLRAAWAQPQPVAGTYALLQLVTLPQAAEAAG